MKQRLFRGTVTPLIMGLFASLVLGQASSYLAQKLMLENDLRKRIMEALEKVIENRKYVVDVSVDLELSSAVEQQTTYKAGGEGKQELTGRELEGVGETSVSAAGEAEARTRTSVGLPIPGFDFEVEETPAGEGTTSTVEEEVGEAPSKTPSTPSNVLSKSYTEKYPSIAKLKHMEISIILQEGAAPELIENIRQVVMVASGFDRTRGDVLSIMTASFKKRRDEKTAEQVLLKNIAEKLESLETQREQLGEVDWRKELENYQQQEAERRQEDKLYFQSKLTELEKAARDRAYEEAKRDILKQDSIRLQALNDEIQNLKAFLGAGAAPDSTKEKIQSSVQDKLEQKASLDAQIAQKLAKLESVQSELDRQYRDGSDNTMVIFVSILGALVIVLIVVLVFLLMNRSKQSVLPPSWMYPPRRKKKSKEPSTPVAAPAAPATQPSPTPTPEPEEDIAVLQSEVNDMKQAVVSMSVGQPKAATKIVKEWIQEAPPPPPEPTAPAAEPEEPETGKKKKKKK